MFFYTHTYVKSLPNCKTTHMSLYRAMWSVRNRNASPFIWPFGLPRGMTLYHSCPGSPVFCQIPGLCEGGGNAGGFSHQKFETRCFFLPGLRQKSCYIAYYWCNLRLPAPLPVTSWTAGSFSTWASAASGVMIPYPLGCVAWASWSLKSQTRRLFVQQVVETCITWHQRKTSKLHINGPLWGESTHFLCEVTRRAIRSKNGWWKPHGETGFYLGS